MSNCDDVLHELSDFVEGRSSSENKKRIAEHLASCTECEKRSNDLRLVVKSLSGLPKVKASSDFNEVLRLRLTGERVDEKHKSAGSEFLSRPAGALILSAAAIALIAFVINTQFLNNGNQPVFSPKFEYSMPVSDISPKMPPAIDQNLFNTSTVTIGTMQDSTDNNYKLGLKGADFSKTTNPNIKDNVKTVDSRKDQ